MRNLPPSQSRIVICGTARNVGKKIEKFVSICESSFSGFQESQFVVCESFSTDNSLLILDKIQERSANFSFFRDTSINLAENRRTVRIASARNQILEYIKDRFADFDYVAMLDVDGVNRDLSRKSVESCWNYEDWDVCTANQPFRYYDIWALRASNWCEDDCWKEYKKLREIMSHKSALKVAVTGNMRSIGVNESPIVVKSAFGGLAIYKMEAFLSSKYVGEDASGNEVCEHVAFHQTLLENGFQIIIAPSLVNLSPRTQILNIVKEFLRKLFVRFQIPRYKVPQE